LAWADYDNDGRLDFLTTGLTNGDSRISQLWRNTGSSFTNVSVPGLPGNFNNSLAWGDYDNDGRLDFLIAGTIEGGNVSQLWRNNAISSNSPSAAPAGLSSIVDGATVVLKWNPPADDHTPAAGLSYNVRIGTTPGGSDIASASALTNGTLLVPRMGAARNGSTAFHDLSPGQTYYWSVQAVDTGFAGSLLAVEQQFTTSPLLINPVHHANGVFEFEFTNRTVLNFEILASTNIALPLTNWTNLGPATSLGGGRYRFTDLLAPGDTQRFYELRSP
jgi:FG-GAP-like repeat